MPPTNPQSPMGFLVYAPWVCQRPLRFVVPKVREATLNYFLTTDSKEFGVEIRWEEEEQYATCIYYLDEKGEGYEILTEEGQDSQIFTGDNPMYQCMFAEGFAGYSIFHVGPVGKLRDVESEELVLVGEVPHELRCARAALVQSWKAEGNKRRRRDSARGKPLPWRSRRHHPHYRKQVCLHHDPANGWFCRYHNCKLDHIDTRTNIGRKRWAGLMAALARKRQ